MAGSKNNPENRKASAAAVKIKMSSDCEACATKCPAGVAYLESINSSSKKVKIGKGVVCNL